MDEEQQLRDPVSLYMSLDNWDDSSSSSQQPRSSETHLLGFLMANIVGLQYYPGSISGREMVGLVREPLNIHDENAIKVLNTRSQQVGHIERSVAAVLAPLIDSRFITVEGIVPNSRTGNKYRIPCQVHVFTRIEDCEIVQQSISRSGLSLITQRDVGFTMSDSMVVKEKVKDRGNKNVDEIFKLVDENVSGKMVIGKKDAPNEIIKSELFPHQKEGLWWLMNREVSNELPPFWEEKDGCFCNVLTNYQTSVRPAPLMGGIFSDDMGLGKTLTLLSLIAHDKISGENSDEKRKANKKGGKGRKKRRRDETTPETYEGGLLASRGTLVVCPPVVLSSWVTQLEEHTHRGSFSIYMYHGDRTKDADELSKYDIVLTTYSTLSAEEAWVESPVKQISWWRVILDEAHVIKNPNAQQSIAVSNLHAKRKWAVSGTPIQNGSYDLFSLMAFLHFEPFSIRSYWQSLIQRPLSQGNSKGISRLQVLMATISLRRTKDKALDGLPAKTVETHYIELAAEEREIYDHMEAEAKGLVQSFIDEGVLMHNYSRVLCMILRLRQICNDVGLCPADMKSLVPTTNIDDVSSNPALLEKIVELLRDVEDLDCPICISPPVDMVITRCAHVFCRNCILKTLKHTNAGCPLCRRTLATSDLFSAPAEADAVKEREQSSTTSSKVAALLKLLTASRGRKSVVFSQFQKMLVVLEGPLREAGFRVARLDGTMTAKKKAQVIGEFCRAEGPEVMLASLKACGAGINLAAASAVYMVEPWWNPAVEEQAMDRVHRIGQKEEVRVVRLIVRDSIEERVLEMQDRKKKLAREAFARGKAAEVRADDVRALMSL